MLIASAEAFAYRSHVDWLGFMMAWFGKQEKALVLRRSLALLRRRIAFSKSRFRRRQGTYYEALMYLKVGQKRAAHILLRRVVARTDQPLLIAYGSLALARSLSKSGKLGKAADYYFYARQFDKAAGLYSRLKRFAAAGDAFYKLGDYRAALKMYQRQRPPNRKKIARTLEKSGELDQALKLWQELKDRKSASRCRAKMEKAKQREIRFPSSD